MKDTIPVWVKVVRRLFKIYTPFICAVFVIAHGWMYMTDSLSEQTKSLFSVIGGSSILLLAYMWFENYKMCVWYKATLAALLCVHVDSLLYYFTDMDADAYYYSTLVFALAGILFFVIFSLCYKVTVDMSCIRRR